MLELLNACFVVGAYQNSRQDWASLGPSIGHVVERVFDWWNETHPLSLFGHQVKKGWMFQAVDVVRARHELDEYEPGNVNVDQLKELLDIFWEEAT